MEGHCGEESDSGQKAARENDIQAVTEVPATDDRHQKHHAHHETWHNDGTKKFTGGPHPLKHFKKLK